MPIFSRDFETFSALDIGDVGAWRYAAHPSTGAWCCAYAVDDGPIKLWTPGSGIPEEFIEAGRNPAWLASAFNAEFERNIERHIMGPRYNFPLIPLERQRCTQAAALMHALPRRLESVALALKLPQQKDTAGAKVMKEFAVPRKPRPGEDPDGGPYWCDDPDKLQQLYAYCRQDVATEREVYRRLGFIPEAEQTVWRLDAQINDRGFPVDREVVDAMFEVVDAVRADLDTELADLTEGAVDRVTKRDKMIAWLASQGCTLKNAQKGTIAHALRRKGLTAEVRRALEVWQAGAHAAAAKPAKMREWMGGDDRVRGTLAYHGARTGRWSARGPQPQNLKRPLTDDLGAAIDTIKSGDLDLIRRTWPQPLAVVGDLGRAMICAPAGSRLIAADFSGIESRTNGWLAGELRKVDLWARFDATGLPGDDPYVVMGSLIGAPPDKARDLGKIADLAFSFGGGQAAWGNFAPEGDASTPLQVKKMQMAWRRAHPCITAFWKDLEAAAIRAIEHPGERIACNEKIAFIREGDFLFAELPSGRRLAYPFPRVEITPKTIRYLDDDGQECAMEKTGPVLIYGEVGLNGRLEDIGKGEGENKKIGSWGGTLCENVVSAVARDLLAAAMQRVDAAGYETVLTVHDEIVAEVPDGFGSLDEFSALMIALPDWAAGLPVACKTREGPRFCKIKPASEASIMPDKPILPAPKVIDLYEIFNICSALHANATVLKPKGVCGAVKVLEKPNERTENGNAVLDAALAYAEKGTPIFPCINRPGTEWHKRPHVGPDRDAEGKKIVGTGGFHKATTDLDQIRAWWRTWPNALIAVPTGPVSGFAVIDLDRKNGKDGFAAVPDWQTRTPVRARTGSGGAHLFFQSEGAPSRCSASQIAAGIDVRAQGGYVILAPSAGYAWENGGLDLSVLPPWPADLLPPERECARERAAPADRDRLRVPLPEHEVTRIKAALDVIPADDEPVWIEIGAALYDAVGEAGWPIYDAWSQKSTNYCGIDACREKWEHAKEFTAYTIRTIFHRANDACLGWTKAHPPQHDAAVGFGVAMPRHGAAEAAGAPEGEGGARTAAAPAVLTAQAAKKKKGKLHFTCLADVEAEKVNWMWPNRLARGKIAILAGDSTLGKSQITTDWTARLTKIGMWPDGSPAPIGSVIILSAEDAIKDTIRPRFEAAGGDYSRVHCLSFVEGEDGTSQTFSLQDDLQALGDKIRAVGDVLMVVIDPITAYMGSKIDSHRVTDVRAVLAPLEKFAEQYDVAVLVVAHPAKASQVKAINIISGSAAFAQAPRLAFLVIEDPERIEDRRLLLAFKNSLGRKAPGLGYSIEEVMVGRCGDIPAPRIKWDVDPVTVTADEALAALADRKRAAAVTEAADFLRDRLAGGPVATAAIEKEAEERGITKRTLERARRKLNVKAKKDKGDFQGPWKLHLVVDNDAEDGSPPKDA